ncbi:SGNH/GDSL hydrolase family protein [Taibaiella chishuiensis]|uniref:Lysophospholipase L1-like esterase n=1 Tax=Taibaiella chishuiensis TaxID=1434707 RepID=A0A2P8CW72_9BACT|nr:SGNH/GDSL hydrolase family protein [Taibaiella chishuiensis]PSK89222.1 lysophospholipase L1-like esterase [Taibaiella chishuiensis]
MLTYLALGDSYTIGEQVPAEDNFPHQAAKLLREQYHTPVSDPKIIAVTGWTTDELEAGIKAEQLQDTYDFVTLLIGVNNQYRNRDTANYREEFTALLDKAIRFANGHPAKVFVLSIPDWGVTPFAEGKDRREIATQIDRYNDVNREIAAAHHCPYIDITPVSRQQGTDLSFLVEDKLHYSGKAYKVWAELLAPLVANAFKD